MKIGRIIKALIFSCFISGALLLLVTFIMYKFDLSEQVMTGGTIAIYVVSTLLGGFVLGKMMKVRKYVWGMILGLLYFALLFVLTIILYGKIETNLANLFTTLLICVGSGTFGGMIS